MHGFAQLEAEERSSLAWELSLPPDALDLPGALDQLDVLDQSHAPDQTDAPEAVDLTRIFDERLDAASAEWRAFMDAFGMDYKVGQRVQFFGLAGRTDLNECFGIIEGWDEQGERWRCRVVETFELVRVRSEKLRPDTVDGPADLE